MKPLSIIAAILVCFAAFPVLAQDQPADNMEIVRDAIRAEKKALIAENLGLTESEATAFWPVYDEYQQAIKKINDERIALIEAYAEAYNAGTMNDESAENMIKKSMQLDGDYLKLVESYYPKFVKVLPAKKVARYYQIENKIRAVIQYDLAAGIPLVD